MRYFRLVFPLLFVVLLLNSCGLKEAMDEATKTTNSFYDALKKQEYQKIVDMTHEYWLNDMPYHETFNFYQQVDEVMGPVKSFEITNVNTLVTKGEEDLNGTKVTVDLKVIREKKETEERVIFFKENETDTLKVLNYHIK